MSQESKIRVVPIKEIVFKVVAPFEKIDELKKRAIEACDLDNEIESKAVAYPGGKLHERITLYKLSDNFEDICIKDTAKENEFEIEFHPRKDANPFWKDLVVRILHHSLRKSDEEITISFVSKVIRKEQQ